jgi:F-type H+-transporting ATPase subunit delta
MPKISPGKRYAQAVFELALERNELEVWQTGLKKMADLTTDQELMALLQNPRIPFDAKKDLLKKRLGDVHPLVMNLAVLLVTKGNLYRSRDIFQKYNNLLDIHRGVERAEVTAAFPLGVKEGERISRRLGEIIDHKVVIESHLDPSIIGGFIARMGDMLIDGSIRQRLESLKKSLIEAGK